MKFGNFEIPPKKVNDIDNQKVPEMVTLSNEAKISTVPDNSILMKEEGKVEQFIKFPLTEEELKISTKELASKYGLDWFNANTIKKRGYRSIKNPDFVSKESLILEKRNKTEQFLKEVTPIESNSIETILNNPKEQEIIKDIINQYDAYKYLDKYKINEKKYKLLDGEELSFGDIIILNKLIESKVFRDKNGQLMMFYDSKFVPFRPTYFLGDQHRSLIFNGNPEKNEGIKTTAVSLENFSPAIFKKGIFREEDFNKRNAGSVGYEINGPHERKLSPSAPNVFLSNSDMSAKYYLGREKFVGTNKKINHDTIRVSLLDNNTGVVTDTINGRKLILYTFPLINKEDYERQKEEVINRRALEDKSPDVNINNYITTRAVLKEYSITDYIPKNINESEKDYIDKISKLSDTSYVLGNFKSFMSKTGLAANNYSWREQLVLADALTSVENKEKIVNFGKTFSKDGLRTFLSIEQGGKEMGDKILTLGEKLPEEVAEKVFTKYGEIIDNVSKITEFTRTNFTKEIETSPELVKKIEETLYIKGKQLLSQTYDDISNKKEINYEDIGKQLDRINADTITTFAIFKQAVKNGEKLPIESIEGAVFSKKEATNIPDKQQNEMLELYESNWKNHPDRNFVESLKSYFKTAFAPEDNKQKNYFYTFEKDNNIRAFVRFEKQNDASFYASALNVDEASKNFGLGEAMMDEALTIEAKEHILHASCRKDNPSNMRYFEKGFISKGFKKTNETEEFDLVWDENKNKDILAKQKSQEELILMYGNNNEDIVIKKSKDLESLNVDIPQGKSLVRCFVNNGEWYAVYEKVAEDYGMNLGEIK